MSVQRVALKDEAAYSTIDAIFCLKTVKEFREYGLCVNCESFNNAEGATVA